MPLRLPGWRGRLGARAAKALIVAVLDSVALAILGVP
jgi:hypothetical protein